MASDKGKNTKVIDLSFCIVNWNTADLTSQLIQSVYNTVHDIQIEILVVDNSSTDNSVLHIENYYPEVIVIKNTINVGYGRALNQALKMAQGRYRLILNSDVVLLENSVEEMISFLENQPVAGAVGPICLDKNGNIGHSYGYFPRPVLMILERLLGSMTPKYISPPPLWVRPKLIADQQLEVEYIVGACIMVKNEVCKEVGLFDDIFFAYYEETDWCFRMMKKGIKRYILPKAKVIHYYDSSFSQVPDKKNNYFEDSKVKYLRKHYGWAITNIYIFANALANIRQNIRNTLRTLKNDSNRKSMNPQK